MKLETSKMNLTDRLITLGYCETVTEAVELFSREELNNVKLVTLNAAGLGYFIETSGLLGKLFADYKRSEWGLNELIGMHVLIKYGKDEFERFESENKILSGMLNKARFLKNIIGFDCLHLFSSDQQSLINKDIIGGIFMVSTFNFLCMDSLSENKIGKMIESRDDFARLIMKEVDLKLSEEAETGSVGDDDQYWNGVGRSWLSLVSDSGVCGKQDYYQRIKAKLIATEEYQSNLCMGKKDEMCFFDNNRYASHTVKEVVGEMLTRLVSKTRGTKVLPYYENIVLNGFCKPSEGYDFRHMLSTLSVGTSGDWLAKIKCVVGESSVEFFDKAFDLGGISTISGLVEVMNGLSQDMGDLVSNRLFVESEKLSIKLTALERVAVISKTLPLLSSKALTSILETLRPLSNDKTVFSTHATDNRNGKTIPEVLLLALERKSEWHSKFSVKLIEETFDKKRKEKLTLQANRFNENKIVLSKWLLECKLENENKQRGGTRLKV